MPALVYPQISQANLQGTVKDSTSAVVPAASVTLTNSSTGTARAATTGTDGQYFIPNINPGAYKLTVALQGFKTFTVENLTLETGQSATVDATLELGTSTQQVTITSEVPLISTASSDVSHLVPALQVANIPLNGRNFWELTQLTPGATFTPRAQFGQASSVAGSAGTDSEISLAALPADRFFETACFSSLIIKVPGCARDNRLMMSYRA